MLMVPIDRLLTPIDLQKTDGSLVGTTVRVDLPRDWPLEEIFITCDLTVGTAFSSMLVDGALGLIKRVRLITNSTKQVPVVDYSGVGLLELDSQVGLNLDHATLGLISEHTKATAGLPTTQLYRCVYRIPMVHPKLRGALRAHCLLPIHNHSMNPQLQIDFSSQAEMATGSVTKLTADVLLRQRKITSGIESKIQANGGYIENDLIETVQSLGTGVTGEQRFDIPVPGRFAGLMCRFYKGGAAVTRGDISENVTTGTESVWRIESGGFIFKQSRVKHIRAINDRSRTLNSQLQASSPSIGAAVASTVFIQDPCALYYDFLTDDVNEADELGSTLDCNFPYAQGQKMQLIGPVASAATNGHKVYIGGHRFYGDLSRWITDK